MHCRTAISLVALLCLAPVVSLAQSAYQTGSTRAASAFTVSSDNRRELASLPESTNARAEVLVDLFTAVPPSDVLITIDIKRVFSEAVPSRERDFR